MLPKLVITDIDGVWTDGGMYYTAQGDIMKRFSVKDGWGVIFLRRLGIPLAIMTGENTEIVRKRAEKLKIERCYLGVKNKLAATMELCREMEIGMEDVAFVGDDINDLALLKEVGTAACPPNTPDYVKAHADILLSTPGGSGAFREFVETILRREGMLAQTVELCTDKT